EMRSLRGGERRHGLVEVRRLDLGLGQRLREGAGHDPGASRDLEDAAGAERPGPEREIGGVRREEHRAEKAVVDLGDGAAEVRVRGAHAGTLRPGPSGGRTWPGLTYSLVGTAEREEWRARGGWTRPGRRAPSPSGPAR